MLLMFCTVLFRSSDRNLLIPEVRQGIRAVVEYLRRHYQAYTPMQNLQNEMEIIKNEEAQLCLTDSDGNFLLDANGNYLVITS